MNKTAKIFAFVFWALATGLFLTAMLTDYWAAGHDGERFGLFKAYMPLHGSIDFGWNIHPSNGLFLLILLPRIMMLLGAALIVLGVLIGLVGICTGEGCPMITEGCFEILGGLVILGACGTFTSQDVNFILYLERSASVGLPYHYSYYFGWISGAMFILSGLFSIASVRKSTYY